MKSLEIGELSGSNLINCDPICDDIPDDYKDEDIKSILTDHYQDMGITIVKITANHTMLFFDWIVHILTADGENQTDYYQLTNNEG